MIGKIIVCDPDDEGMPLGLAEVRLCTSQDHEQRIATHVAHWADGPTDKCEACAAQLLGIAKVMGYHCHVELISYPEIEEMLAVARKRRSIALDGVPK